MILEEKVSWIKAVMELKLLALRLEALILFALTLLAVTLLARIEPFASNVPMF